MALPDIIVRARARIGGALSGLDLLRRRYRETGAAADEAAGASDRFNTASTRVATKSSPLARGIQNASFQFGDLATQIGAGTSASIALGQQLPQLLGGFGILGAVMGAVVAIAVPLTRVIRDMGESGQQLTTLFGTLEPAILKIGEAFRIAGQYAVQAAEVIINNLDRIITIALTAAAIFGGRYVASMVAARVATMTLAGSLAFLRGAIIRTGFGALIVGAGELVYQFTRLMKAAGGFGEAIALLQQIAKEAFQNIDVLGQALADGLQGTALWISAQFLKAFDVIRSGFASMVDAMLSSPILEALGVNLGKMASDSIRNGGFSDEIAKLEGQAGGLFGRSADGFRQAMPSLEKMRDLMKSMKDERITLPDILGLGGGGDEDEEGKKGSGGSDAEKSASEKLDEELTAQEERIKAHFDRIKALTQAGLSNKLGAWGDYFSNLVSMTGTNNKRILAIAKAFKASQALIDAWSAYNQVLADPSFVGRPWARAAAAAQVLAAGIGAYNAIRSVGDNGSGQTAASGGSASGSSGAAAAGTGGGEATGRSSNVLLQLNGEVFGREQVRDLINRINEEVESGATIRVV